MVKRKKNNRSKIILLAVVLVLLMSVAGYFIYKRSVNNSEVVTEVRTTSTAPSAQADYTTNTNDNRTPAKNDSEKGSAVVVDNQGQQTTTPDQAQWTTSETGQITVYEPAKNQIATKGTIVSGVSSLPVVYYRVIDDVSGMIAQGQLSVVGGKFSGTLSFATTASNGRIDVYGADDSGKELSSVELQIRFK